MNFTGRQLSWTIFLIGVVALFVLGTAMDYSWLSLAIAIGIQFSAVPVMALIPRKEFHIGRRKQIANEEYIAQMEQELGMSAEIQDDVEATSWLSNYPLRPGWKWEFKVENVTRTITHFPHGTQTTKTQQEVGVYLITEDGQKWRRTKKNVLGNQIKDQWVSPLPPETFEQRLEVKVAATYKDVVERYQGKETMAEVLKKLGAKNGD